MAILFEENWNGSSIDTSTWNVVSGSYSVSSNNLTGYFRMNTTGKKSFTCGAKTVIEFATKNNNTNQDISLVFTDVSNSSNNISFYCNENYYTQGIRIDFGGIFGSDYTNTGGDVTDKQYYRITFEGTSIKIQQGSSYGIFDRELSRTASATTAGKTFFLSIDSNNGSTGTGTFYPILITDGVTTSIKSINGLSYASVKSYNGLAKASIKNINGLS